MGLAERTRMQVRVLGDIAVTGDGARPITGPSVRRAFALLVARRDETTTIDQLIDACWPGGSEPAPAPQSIRSYIHRLRAALGEHDHHIETTPGGYRLHLDGDELDLNQFERLAGEATRLIRTGDLIDGLDRAEAAVAMWRGDPYAEYTFEPWARAETARLCEQRVSLLEHHAEGLLLAGQPADAVARLEQLARDEPYRERPRALLMRALYESGRQAEALRAFQEFRRRLIDEVGVDPSADLVDLDRAIVSNSLDRTSVERHPMVGAYELHERIGEGAFAIVHRAIQVSVGREVAIKIIRAELANRPAFIRRFHAEAQMVASIEHPNVVPLYDYWREPGNAYLVMRWMTGGSLTTRLDDGPLHLADVVELVEQLAGALDAAHARGIVHRDVKPDNIFFDDTGHVYLGDFGIALSADEHARPQAALSEGSPVFASPEQLRREGVGPEADVHALGIVTFNALTGRIPFHDASDEREQLRRQLDEPVPWVSTVRPGLPRELDMVVAVATAKRAGDRYATASGFAAAFRSAAGISSGPARVVGRPRVNPYRGLRPFTEVDATDFHGRDRLTAELVDACSDPDRRLVSVVGASGSGKSSAIRAGLVPALRAGALRGASEWFITTMVPGAHPFETLETALLRVAINPPPALLEQLRDGDRGIHRGACRIVSGGDRTVLLVIDQFEELFTLAAPDDRDRFLRALFVAVTEPGGPLRVVTTMRADFYDQPLRHPDFAPLFKTSTVAVTPLAPDELEEAITTPAAHVGVDFESGLIAEIMADTNRQPGALPLLQYALTTAFDATEGNTIATDTYRAMGGLTGALTRQAEDFYATANADEHRALRQLLERLVTLGEGTDDTRRRVRRSELSDDIATEHLIDRLGAARLLTFDRDARTREPTVEIAHEALIREWPRLQRWLDDDRDTLRAHRHLTAAAAAWIERGRDPADLYTGSRLETAERLTAGSAITLSDDETEFVGASLEQHRVTGARERARTVRLRRLTGASVAIAVVALIAGVAAVVQWRRADDQARLAAQREQEAVDVSIESTAQRLVAQALETDGQGDPDLPILLALESLTRTDAAGLAPTEGAIEALHTVTQRSRLLDRFPNSGESAMDPTGTEIAVGDDAGHLTFIDVASRQTTGQVSLGAEVVEVTYLPDDHRVIAATDSEIALIDVDDLSILAIEELESELLDIEVERGGGRIATEHGLEGRRTIVWNTDLEHIKTVDDMTPAGWSDGDLIVFDDEGVYRLDVDDSSSRPIAFSDADVRPIRSVDANPAGDQLVVGGGDGVGIWSLEGPRSLIASRHADLGVELGVVFQWADFAGDGGHVLVYGPGEELLVQPLGTGDWWSLRGHNGIREVSITADGRTLLASGDGEALLWDVTIEGPRELGAVAVDGNVWEIEFADDATMFVSDSPDGGAQVREIDMTSRETRVVHSGFGPTRGSGVAIAASAGLIAGWRGGDLPSEVLDAHSGDLVVPLDACLQPSSIDADGRWAYAACVRDGEQEAAVVFDPATGRTELELPDTSGFAVFGPPGTDSDGLLVYQGENGFEFHDLHSGAAVGQVDISGWRPFFSDDGRYVTFGGPLGGFVVDVEQVLASAPSDQVVVLNPQPGTGAATFSVVAGEYFVTGHDGQELRFWRLDDGGLEWVLPVESGDSTFLAPTPDGSYLYYESEGNLLRRFPLDPDDLRDLARRRVQRDFTMAECETYQLADDCSAFVTAR